MVCGRAAAAAGEVRSAEVCGEVREAGDAWTSSPRRFLRPVSRSLARRPRSAEIHSLTAETKTLTTKKIKQRPAMTSRTCELNMRGLLIAGGEPEVREVKS